MSRGELMFRALAMHVASDAPGRVNVSLNSLFTAKSLDVPVRSHWVRKEVDRPNRSLVLYEFFVVHALRTLNSGLRCLFYQLIFDFVDSRATYEHAFRIAGLKMRRKFEFAYRSMRKLLAKKNQLPEVYEKKLVFPKELDFPPIFLSTYGFSTVHLGYEVRVKNGTYSYWLQSKVVWKYDLQWRVHNYKTRVLYFDAQSYIDAE